MACIRFNPLKVFLIAFAFLSLPLIGFPQYALAGECPPNKVGVKMTERNDIKPVGVTDKVMAAINLKKLKLGEHDLRLRRLVVRPGGTVPNHSHATRPAIIFILSGEITEYRTTCGAPITHRPGEAIAEFGAGLSHWWRNDGKRPAVLLSADVFHAKMGESEMME